MAQNKPSLPRGTRDFTPAEMIRRKHIFSMIENTFLRYGYQPIETPAMENLSALMGKYGEEGDKLLFKILNSGDYLQEVEEELLHSRNASRLSMAICERGLRYDLTVPFARYVVQHRNEIQFPFKRYQIQPVWRADKPQKGRYREFYQCDVDGVGSDALLNEAELIQIADEVFSLLGLKTIIRINHRKILNGLAEYAGVNERITDLTVALDKLEKVGQEQIFGELRAKGFTDNTLGKIKAVLEIEGTHTEKLIKLKNLLKDSSVAMKGFSEMEEIMGFLAGIELSSVLQWELSLARGLDYYTGTIIEVTSSEVEIGSICGGGRYDDLTGIFGLPGVSGVGISFGADRIYDVMQALERFPLSTPDTTRILFVNFGLDEARYCTKLLKKIREAGIPAEIYPENAKLKKQLGYADSRKIPFVAMVGEEEMSSGQITLKEMQSGHQEKISLEALITRLQS